jgi:hypothetical protein
MTHALRLLLVAGALGLACPAIAAAGPLSTEDRQQLVAHFELTEAWLATELQGLSTAQLTFRPRPGVWSIKDVVEHLGIAETQYWKQLNDALARPAGGFTARTTDTAILWYGIDRTERTTTGDARVPDGRFATAAEGLASFRALRKTMLDMARSTKEDLRGRQFGGGGMDAYQWYLMISTHAMRHILQIREIKAASGYPTT